MKDMDPTQVAAISSTMDTLVEGALGSGSDAEAAIADATEKAAEAAQAVQQENLEAKLADIIAENKDLPADEFKEEMAKVIAESGSLLSADAVMDTVNDVIKDAGSDISSELDVSKGDLKDMVADATAAAAETVAATNVDAVVAATAMADTLGDKGAEAVTDALASIDATPEQVAAIQADIAAAATDISNPEDLQKAISDIISDNVEGAKTDDIVKSLESTLDKQLFESPIWSSWRNRFFIESTYYP